MSAVTLPPAQSLRQQPPGPPLRHSIAPLTPRDRAAAAAALPLPFPGARSHLPARCDSASREKVTTDDRLPFPPPAAAGSAEDAARPLCCGGKRPRRRQAARAAPLPSRGFWKATRPPLTTTATAAPPPATATGARRHGKARTRLQQLLVGGFNSFQTRAAPGPRTRSGTGEEKPQIFRYLCVGLLLVLIPTQLLHSPYWSCF